MPVARRSLLTVVGQLHPCAETWESHWLLRLGKARLAFKKALVDNSSSTGVDVGAELHLCFVAPGVVIARKVTTPALASALR